MFVPGGPEGARFQILSRLGQGGMGIVYRAFDRERRAEVALKTLPHLHGKALARLKHEFRSFADVRHPNLVALHELFVTERECYFTMELVHGMDFVSFVRHGVPVADGDRAPTLRTPQHELLSERSDAASKPRPRGATHCDLARLKPALLQLSDAVEVMHSLGKLHMDLKPSNVLIERSTHRVVVLDFGLVRELAPRRTTPIQGGAAGTPEYMAPEILRDLPLGPALDWYAVGVMLYEALTGELPFKGRNLAVFTAKATEVPLSPSAHVSGVPEALDTLCLGLLQADPNARASARALRDFAGARVEAGAPFGRHSDIGLVGRGEELDTLRKAAERALHAPTMVLVRGPSGIGKTALIQAFLDELSERGTLVLSGRCYERESLPFKAFDSVIDELAEYLRSLNVKDLRASLPPGIPELARVFRVLEAVPAISERVAREHALVDPTEARARAFRALKALLFMLSKQRPIAIFSDDLQWGDRDSALLLSSLLHPPDAPNLLWVGSARRVDGEKSAFLREVAALHDVPEALVLNLGPLGEAEARELVSRQVPKAEALAELAVREGAGNPFFIRELAHLLEEEGKDHQRDEDLTLENLFERRLTRISKPARKLLEAVAFAGGPLPRRAAFRAAGLTSDSDNPLTELSLGRFVKVRDIGAEDRVETVHDRLREGVVRTIPQADHTSLHLTLAEALEAEGVDQAEFALVHYEAAGERSSVRRLAESAGDQAAQSLAFNHAANLYARALATVEPAFEGRGVIEEKRAFALRNAGRGKEAAESFLRAAKLNVSTHAVDLQRLSAEQYLVSGYIDEGLSTLREVLSAVNLSYPSSPERALAALLWRRARLRLRGLGFKATDASQIDALTLAKIDLCFSVSLGLSIVDTIQAASFQSLQTLLALDAGEPGRIALGLAFEAGYVATAGASAQRQAEQLITRASDLASSLKDPHPHSFVTLMRGVCDWSVGRFHAGLCAFEAAEESLRTRCTGVPWQLDTAQLFQMVCLTTLGDFATLLPRHRTWMEDAEARGDRYLSAGLHINWGAGTWLKLAADKPEEARASLDRATASWSRQGFLVQHYYAMMSHALIDIYQGDPVNALRRIEEAWPELQGSMLLRVQSLRITALTLRATAQLAVIEQEPPREKRLRADLEALSKEGVAWSMHIAELLTGALLLKKQRSQEALSHFSDARTGFALQKMRLHAAAAARGAALCGAGSARVAEANEQLAAQGVKEPKKFLRLFGVTVG